jgi:Cytochrome P460
MIARTIALLLSASAFLSPPVVHESGALGSGPEFTQGGELKLPQGYREWIYLTSGFDMSYNPVMQMRNQHMFDNVFVNPEAYKAFVNTGTWPDKTILVLEGRVAQGKGSINQSGNFQAGVMDLELHVKDETRFPGKWAFFAFGGGKTAKAIPTTADCYTCHAQHAAADTTFVQFYPTLLPIAKEKRTLSASYLKEEATPVNR